MKKIQIAFLILLFASGCKKEKEDEVTTPVHETGTMTDADGNMYRTIKIGNQWWMAENLKTIRYRDSSLILHLTNLNATQWSSNTTGAYCEYEDGNSTPGLLYNWFSVSSEHNLAPAGWHIPSDDEWKELERNLGMSPPDADNSGWRGSHVGDKLKIGGTEGWRASENVWPTNESGFTALAGSCRLFDGSWGSPGLTQTGFWWTSTASANEAWYRYLDYKNANVFRSHCSQNYGFSVRCIKD
jgi:uncharacterized protein (TIGR02145 family)